MLCLGLCGVSSWYYLGLSSPADEKSSSNEVVQPAQTLVDTKEELVQPAQAPVDAKEAQNTPNNSLNSTDDGDWKATFFSIANWIKAKVVQFFKLFIKSQIYLWIIAIGGAVIFGICYRIYQAYTAPKGDEEKDDDEQEIKDNNPYSNRYNQLEGILKVIIGASKNIIKVNDKGMGECIEIFNKLTASNDQEISKHHDQKILDNHDQEIKLNVQNRFKLFRNKQTRIIINMRTMYTH